MTTLQFSIYVASVLVSPLLAVQATLMIQHYREKRERRLSVFKALMRTRASGLHPDHVQALNSIHVEFYGSDAKTVAVLRSFKAYLEHLNTGDPSTSAWATRKDDLFTDLLFAMGRCLGYDFDMTDIRRTAYFPRGYGDAEADQLRIRRGLADIVEAKRPLPVSTWTPPSKGPEVEGKSGTLPASGKTGSDA